MDGIRPSGKGRPRSAAAALAAWVAYALITSAVLGTIAVGSLAPFRFDASKAWRAQRIGHLGFPHSDVKDVTLNFSAYLVVGFVLAWGVSRRGPRHPRFTALAHATSGGVALSVLMEMAQTMLPGRCASWIDVAMNAAGAALGALGWIWLTRPAPTRREALALGHLVDSGATRTHGAAWLGGEGSALLSRALPFAVMLLAVAPFDFVQTAEFGGALRRAELPPAAAVWGGRLLPDGPAPLLHTVMLSGDVLLALGFAILAATSFRGRLLQGGTFAEAAGAALGRSILLAVLAETLQLFSAHHAFDLIDLARNLAAIAAGLLLAALTTRGPAQATAGTPLLP